MHVRMWPLAPLALGVVLICDLMGGPADLSGSAAPAPQPAPVSPGQGLTAPQPVAQPALAPGVGTSVHALTESVRFEAHAVATGDVVAALSLLAASCRPEQRARIAEAVPAAQPVPALAASYVLEVGPPATRRQIHYEITTADGTRSADEYWTARSGNWRRLCGRPPKHSLQVAGR